MDALKGYQLNSVPTRGHAKAQAKAVGMDLCGAPVTAVCTVPCLKINSKLQSLLLLVIQSKRLVLALTPCKLSFQHLPCRLFSLTPGLYLAPASQTSGMLVLDNFCLWKRLYYKAYTCQLKTINCSVLGLYIFNKLTLFMPINQINSDVYVLLNRQSG